MDTLDEIKAEKEGWRRPPMEIDNVLDYAKVLVGFVLDMASKVHLHKNDWHRTVFIDAAGVGTTDFDLPDSKVQVLVENGKKGMEEYLTWFRDGQETPANRV